MPWSRSHAPHADWPRLLYSCCIACGLIDSDVRRSREPTVSRHPPSQIQARPHTGHMLRESPVGTSSGEPQHSARGERQDALSSPTVDTMDPAQCIPKCKSDRGEYNSSSCLPQITNEAICGPRQRYSHALDAVCGMHIMPTRPLVCYQQHRRG